MLWFAIAILGLAVVVFLGPRVRADLQPTFDAQSIGADVEAYLKQAEEKVGNVRGGLQKEIVWADPGTKARTPLAIVCVHGFSASKGELRPLPDRVAASLGANLFFARLTGHAQDGTALANATVKDWINDFAEAVAIGSRIGERVVVMATSTGGALATVAAADPALSANIAGLVLVSPNYGVRAGGAWLLTQPWGGQLAALVVGRDYTFEPRSEQHARLWTTHYPTAALLPMASLSKAARRSPVETIGVPALFVFSDRDQVVRPDLTRAIAARWGAWHETVVVNDSDDPAHHVIAGDALSPSTTGKIADRIVAWISATVTQPALSGRASREKR